MAVKKDKTVNKKVRAAKKLIRKGKNQKGSATVRAKVQDKVGKEHRYDRNSPVIKKLDSSRLVQRKYKQERKSLAKSQISRRGYKDWVGESKYEGGTYTKKTAKATSKKIRKSYKADAKKTTKVAKASAKATRKSIRKK